MNEEWRWIKGYEGLYQVSNLGRVKSIYKKEHLFKPYKNKKGYLIVCLTKNKKSKILRVHRLVAQAFLPNPHNYKEINHKDENKENNYLENLEWCDRKYNCNWGKRNKKISKPVLQYDLHNNLIKTWDSIAQAQKELKCYNISHCINNKRKTAGGYIWRYK